LGRRIGVDPVFSSNVYETLDDSPGNYVDPSGLDKLVIENNDVWFERNYNLTPWKNGGTYRIGSLVEIKNKLYVKHGPYLVPLEKVDDVIDTFYSSGVGGDWRSDPNSMTAWFKANDVAGKVLKPDDQRDVAGGTDRMFGPTATVGTIAAITVLTMVT